MIERRGRVMSVHNGMASIRLEADSACASCVTRGACGSAAARVVRLPINDVPWQSGDAVTLSMEEGAIARGALLAYLLPAVATLAGAIAVAPLGDLAAVAGAASGLGFGLVVLRLAHRRQLRRHTSPEIRLIPSPCLTGGSV